MMYDIRYEANGNQSRCTLHAESDEHALQRFVEWWDEEANGSAPSAWIVARWSITQ